MEQNTDVLILGGGHVGVTLLADVLACRDRHGLTPRLAFLGERGPGCEARARALTGELRMHHVPDGIDTQVLVEPEHLMAFGSRTCTGAANQARLILVTVPDIPALRLPILDWLADEVDLVGKTVVFVRAGQAGQVVIADWIRRTPDAALADFALIEDSFYGTRVLDRQIDFKRKLSVNVTSYSRRPVDDSLGALRAIFPLGERIGRRSWPDFVPRDGVDLQFDPLGYIIHVGVALYGPNLARTRAGVAYTHYIDGIDRPLAAQLDQLDQERLELGRAFGAQPESFPRIIERQYGLPHLPDFYEMMQSCRGIYRSMSSSSIPELLASRHILEDIPGLHTISWLASVAGVELPATTAHAERCLDTLDQLGADHGPLGAYRPLLRSLPRDRDDVRDLLSAPLGGPRPIAVVASGRRHVPSVVVAGAGADAARSAGSRT
jgi:opine dehydrogenase